MFRKILTIGVMVAVATVIYFVIRGLFGDVLTTPIDVNNTPQLIQVGSTFVVSLALVGGFTAVSLAMGLSRRKR